MKFRILVLAILIQLAAFAAYSQTTEFTYQGSLKDGASAADGNYDFEFALFDALSAGNQLGATIPKNNIAVTNGIFSVKLDFGSQFPGANRYLEIRVRLVGQPVITTLTPRQLVNSAPYSVKSLNTDTATNATQLGGVAANQYVVTTDPRMTDSRNPVAGSANYIQNTSSPQSSSNFNISGTGTANIFNAATQFNIGGTRILSNPGSFNLFAGQQAGQANTSGTQNSFFGGGAGQSNTSGNNNAFFGTGAGTNTLSGSNNAFFGSGSGSANTTASANSFFGTSAGQSNSTGTNNAFFGAFAGQSSTASSNSFFGRNAGVSTTTGGGNTFVGSSAGSVNTTGTNNTLVGAGSDLGANNLTFASAFGVGAVVNSSNSVVLGRVVDTVRVPGDLTVTGTSVAASLSASSIIGSTITGVTVTGTNVNSLGEYRIDSNHVFSVPATNNTFAGRQTGTVNTGADNSFFGFNAGNNNTSGADNSFFGSDAGGVNTSGDENTFFGSDTGDSNTTGNHNSFFGRSAGTANTQGTFNTFIGWNAGATTTTGDNNTLIGAGTGFYPLPGFEDFSYATAIGAGSEAFGPNSITLGRFDGSDIVLIQGDTTINGFTSIHLDTAGTTQVCKSGTTGHLSTCSSSLRYKTNINHFSHGLKLINQLKPITFDWKDGGMHDLGLGAEDVEKIEPLLVTYNDKGQVEGVKYDRIGVVLINAVKEQQSQIEEQQKEITAQKALAKTQQEQIEALARALCSLKPDLEICKQK